MKAMKTLLLPAAAAACAFAAQAADYAWTNDVAKAANWNAVGNWVVDGATPAEPPTNAAHAVAFGPLAHDGRQEITLDCPAGLKAGARYGVALASVADETPDSRRTVYFKNGNGGLKEYGFDVTFGVTDFFTGYWRSNVGNVYYHLADGTTFGNLSAAARAHVDVPSGSAALTSVYTPGVLEKSGAGTLRVNATRGADTRLAVAAGTLEIAGRPAACDAGDDLPVPGAWLHLDATRPETFKSFVDPDDGRTYVTNWADVRGNGAHAWFDAKWVAKQTYLSEISRPPFLHADFQNGLTVMDFGRDTADSDAADVPQGCWLKLSQANECIREAFYAGCYLRNFSSTIITGNWIDGVDNRLSFHRGGQLLVNVNYGLPAVRWGDVLVNGEPQSNQWAPPTDFHVFGVGATGDVMVSAIATDRMYANRVGGARVGEIILFTNALTHAQRAQIETHLMQKWGVNGAAAGAIDAAEANLRANAALSVPAGRVVKVEEVTAGDGTLVKKGAGTLEVGVLAVPSTGSATKPTLAVQGGDVVFTGVAKPATDAEPAANAWLWLDADARSSFVFTNKTDDAAEYVARWNDCRAAQTAVWAEIPVGKKDYVAGNFASRMEGVQNGRAVVDFGPVGKQENGSAYLTLNADGYQKRVTYEGFIVFCLKTNSMNVPAFGYSGDITFYRASSLRLLQAGYGTCRTQNAAWSVDGVAVDPTADGQGAFAKDRFYVVSVALDSPEYIDLVGSKDRLGQGTAFGGVQVAEQILYDRKLTVAERRQTIAYLMKRWNGATPPFAAQKQELAAVSFADGEDAVVDAEADLAVGALAGGDGSFTKKGAGTLEAPGCEVRKYDALAVAGGTLAVDADVINEAAFHFDASAVDTLTFYVTEDGARTNVTSVADVRGNGVAADAWINGPYMRDGVDRGCTYTNPVWRAVEAAPSVMRPAFDFGCYDGYYLNVADSSASAFHMNAIARESDAKIVEAHAVFMNDAKNSGGTVFGAMGNKYEYMTGGSTLFSKTYAAACVTNGYIALDGETATRDTPYPKGDTGLHLLSVAPTAGTTINAMGCERNINAGGVLISEFIGFTNVLAAADRVYLQKRLLRKWRETDDLPVFPKTFAALDVAAGATFEFSDDVALGVTKLAGAGRVARAALRDVAVLEVACKGGETQPTTVDEGVAFAKAVTLALVGDVAELAEGEHVLLETAAAIDGADVAWTVTGVNKRKWTALVSVKGGNLVLRLAPKGSVLIVR